MLLLPLKVTLMDEVVDLFRRGFSIRKVSRTTGRPYLAVRAHLIRLGLHRITHRCIRNGLVVCKSCGQGKLSNEFPGLIQGTVQCRACRSRANQESHARRHGQSYQALLDSQNGGCAICGVCDGHRSNGGQTCRLALDHDHQTGRLRGLLCNNCNQGLGRFKDSVALLEAALRYLKREQ
jgi:hypothetical protein